MTRFVQPSAIGIVSTRRSPPPILSIFMMIVSSFLSQGPVYGAIAWNELSRSYEAKLDAGRFVLELSRDPLGDPNGLAFLEEVGGPVGSC